MRVAFLLNRFPMLSETFILNQITGLIDRGIEVELFVRGPQPQQKVHSDVARYGLRAVDLFQDQLPDEELWRCLGRTLGVGLRRSPGLLGECLRRFRFGRTRDALQQLYPVAELLERGPFDIVHAHFGMNGNWAVDLREQGAFSGKVVTTFHGGFDLSVSDQQNARVYERLFAKGDLFLPVSDNVRARVISIGCPADRALVHRVGIDLSRFRHRRTSQGARRLRITTIARLVEMKGVEYGIRAVSSLGNRYPGLQYSIAGDGPLRGELEKLIRTLDVAGQVELLGWCDQSEIERLLQESDILLAPSITDSRGSQEGIPTVLMEALASRIPVVATGYSGVPELVRDSTEGYLTRERDVTGVADRLSRLLDNPQMRKQMGAAGRARVEQMHDIERWNDLLVERYRALAETAAE